MQFVGIVAYFLYTRRRLIRSLRVIRKKKYSQGFRVPDHRESPNLFRAGTFEDENFSLARKSTRIYVEISSFEISIQLS